MAFLLERRRRRRYLGNGLVAGSKVSVLSRTRARALCNSRTRIPLLRGKSGTAERKVEEKFSTLFFFFSFQDWFWPSSGTQQQRSRELRARVSKGKTRIRHGDFLFGCEIIRWTGKFWSWQDGNDDAWVTSSCSCWNKILTLCTGIYI